jgi:hypothetical protein
MPKEQILQKLHHHYEISKESDTFAKFKFIAKFFENFSDDPRYFDELGYFIIFAQDLLTTVNSRLERGWEEGGIRDVETLMPIFLETLHVRRWSPARHKFFSRFTKSRIFFILCTWKSGNHFFSALPRDVLHLIFEYSEEVPSLAQILRENGYIRVWLETLGGLLGDKNPENSVDFMKFYLNCQNLFA